MDDPIAGAATLAHDTLADTVMALTLFNRGHDHELTRDVEDYSLTGLLISTFR